MRHNLNLHETDIESSGTIIGAPLDYFEVHYGFNHHQNCQTDHQMKEFQTFWSGEWIQSFASLMRTKVSICLLLLRFRVKEIFIRHLQAAVASLILLMWYLLCFGSFNISLLTLLRQMLFSTSEIKHHTYPG